jgi:hypothetical protein
MPAFDALQPMVDIGAPLASIVDTTTTANTTYICEAVAGSASSAASWRIQRIVVSGGITTTTWAGSAGSYGRFNQVADDRATLTYA